MPYNRKDGKWTGQVRRQGVRKEKKFNTKKEATEWEVQQRQIPNEDWGSQTRITSLMDWANDYLEFAKSKYSSTTYNEKRVVFRRLFEVLDPATPVSRLSKGQVLNFIQSQIKTRSGYAANKDRKNLVAAWNWGKEYHRFSTENPCMVARYPVEPQIRYVPPEEDFQKVYDIAKGQDQIMLLAYYQLAARRGELFRMKWTDVDLGENKVRLWTRKRKNGNLESEWIPITDELSWTLFDHKISHRSEWVFPDPETGRPYSARRRWLRQLCLKAGVKPFGIHAIRHLTASILARGNTPLIQIGGMLRHKNLATTERYIRRLDDLRPVLNLLSIKKAVR